MKKFSLLLSAFCIAIACSAQLKTYSANDSNLDGKVDISDVNSSISEICGTVSSSKVVSADSLNATLKAINENLVEIKSRLTAMEKQGVYKYPYEDDTHEYVDLGLPSGTLWATFNVGATSPEDYGDYFAWGETTPQTSNTYSWASYKWMTSGQSSWTGCTKYTFADGKTSGCWYSNSTYVGTTVDGTTYTNLTKLEAADDAATANWGSNWCMPTNAQQQELVNSSYTSTEWTTVNGVYGQKITSLSNGNSLFLPAAGYRVDSDLNNAGSNGYYWSSELNSYGSNSVWTLYFGSSYVFTNYSSNRFCGRSVRAVRSASQN